MHADGDIAVAPASSPSSTEADPVGGGATPASAPQALTTAGTTAAGGTRTSSRDGLRRLWWGRRLLMALPPQWRRPGQYAVAAGCAVGFVLGVVALVLKYQDGSHPLAPAVAGMIGGYLFLAAGALAHHRDPDNHVGVLLVATGCGFFAEDLQLSGTTWVFGLGLVLARSSSAPLAHLLLSFPDGRLGSTVQRVLAGAAYLVALGSPLLAAMFNDTTVLPGHRANPLLVVDKVGLVVLVNRVVSVVAGVLALGVLAVLLHRWVTASGPRRRVLAPVFGTGLVGAAATVGGAFAPDGHGDAWSATLLWVYLVAFALLPLGFLAGVPRMRLGRTGFATLLAQLATPLPHAELRETLARALGDPSLRIAYWRPDQELFVDADGRPFGLVTTGERARSPGRRANTAAGDTTEGRGGGAPRRAAALPSSATVPDRFVGQDGQAVRLVERDGRRVAALVHDPALGADPRRLDAVVAAAGLALDNQRLAAEVRAQLAEVRASRGRIVEAADAERRRIERDLHDGAQQRLVTARLALRMAQEHPGVGPAVAALLARTAEGLDLALQELRELARGIHPALLTQSGLVAAIDALIDRVPLDVRLDAADVPRLPASVEATGYFVVAEAVTNVLHHARASQMSVAIAHLTDQAGGRLSIVVTDDGVGGADLSAGTGLIGLRDRVSALNGALTIHSPSGRGTSIRVELPTG